MKGESVTEGKFSHSFHRNKIRAGSAWATHLLAEHGIVIVSCQLPYWLQSLAARSSRLRPPETATPTLLISHTSSSSATPPLLISHSIEATGPQSNSARLYFVIPHARLSSSLRPDPDLDPDPNLDPDSDLDLDPRFSWNSDLLSSTSGDPPHLVLTQFSSDYSVAFSPWTSDQPCWDPESWS